MKYMLLRLKTNKQGLDKTKNLIYFIETLVESFATEP